MKRVLLTLAAYAVSLAVVAVVTLFAVIVLAGPHAGLLPGWLEGVVLALGWVTVLALPVALAGRVWRRLK